MRQLGELIVATGANALDAEVLAGALLNAVANKDAAVKEGWRKRGAGFFQEAHRRSRRRARAEPVTGAARERGEASP